MENPLWGVALKILHFRGVDIPPTVKIGKNVRFPHNAIGTVIHENTVIEDDVKIYQGVTIGRSDIYKDPSADFEGFYVGRGAVLCSGAKILCKSGTLKIGENSVIGANAVLTKSTGKNEIWAGIPAKCVGYRDDLKHE